MFFFLPIRYGRIIYEFYMVKLNVKISRKIQIIYQKLFYGHFNVMKRVVLSIYRSKKKLSKDSI